MSRAAAPAIPVTVRWPLRAEHLILAVAGAALTVLVVLPLASLLLSSVSGEGGLTLGHFREALSRRLYVQALKNSLILGVWTALLSVAIGLPMAWAVSRTDVPAKSFIHVTAMIAYLTPPYLTAIAFVNLFSPNAGLANVWIRDVLGLPQLTFNVHSMAGLVLVTVLHTFPFVYLVFFVAGQPAWESVATIISGFAFARRRPVPIRHAAAGLCRAGSGRDDGAGIRVISLHATKLVAK